MTTVRSVYSGIVGLFQESIRGMVSDYEIAHRPRMFAKRIMDNTPLQQIAPVDTKCIFRENRLQLKTLIDAWHSGDNPFQQFFDQETLSASIPLTNITQIRCSKSDGNAEKWRSIYDFGKDTYNNNKLMFRDDAEELIRHFMGDKERLAVSFFEWNQQYLWENTDGSHHFAVAYYHTVNSGTPIFIPVTLTEYSFNSAAYSDFKKQFSIWITHKDNLKPIYDLKWALGLKVSTFEYPLKDSPNKIFITPVEENGISDVIRDCQPYYLPFDKLFVS